MEQWYYVDDGERCGPLDHKRMLAMFGNGKIAPETLVWNQGMDEWQAASKVFGTRKLCPSCGGHLKGTSPCDCSSEKSDHGRQKSTKKASPSTENHFAIAGFIVSLVALPLTPFTCGLSAIPAMVFSVMGLIHTFKYPKSGRRKLAIMGLLISVVSFLLPIAIALAFIIFAGRSS